MSKNSKHKLSLDFGGSLLLTLLFATIGYFVYGGARGFFGVLLITIIITILLFLSLIPYAGGVIYLMLNWLVVIPAILDFTGLYWTGLITLMMVLFSIFSIIVSVIIGLIITIWITE